MAIANPIKTVDTKTELGHQSSQQAVSKNAGDVVETSLDQDDTIKNGASYPSSPIIQKARSVIHRHLEELDPSLRNINQLIHDKPELAYEEFFAHDTLTSFLEEQGFTVRKHAYGLETSFEAEIGQGGRLVVFCAE